MQAFNIPMDFLSETMQKRVLVVDDDEVILKQITAALKKEPDLAVITARTGFQTGMLTWEHRPHVILLDIKLDDIDGRDICRTLRANPEFADTRIIALSGQIGAEDEKGLQACGFNGFIRKPFEFTALVAAIRSALKR
ncbi:MAG: response regulator [Planctomycetota bacterium]